MTEFTVNGPKVINVYKGVAGRVITDDNIAEFWRSNRSLASKIGCYLFAIRAGKGYTPIYVGKASKSFKQEVFSSHKLSKYQQAMVDYSKGTPVMFFIVYPLKKGKTNEKHIKKLEEFLIQTSVAANPDLMNIRGVKSQSWSIKGVLRSSKGPPTANAKELKKVLNIK